MRVFVAMSGGVDSSVAAALLVEAGHEVCGITMQLLPSSESASPCCGEEAIRSARRVCAALGIEHYVFNMRELFNSEVVAPLIRSYLAGSTPNPCIDCNDRVKFSALLARVRSLGGDALATGHYASIERDGDRRPWLHRGVDPLKDQSYFLYRLTEPAIESVCFPLGGFCKSEVREFAARHSLPTASRPDSQDVCFAGKEGLKAYVKSHALGRNAQPGRIVDIEGRTIGSHPGVAYFTIGQRKGLGLSSKGALYVTAIDAASNVVVVGKAPALDAVRVMVTAPVWRLGVASARVAVQTRYRGRPVGALVRYDPVEPVRGSGGRVEDAALVVDLDEPIRGIAPGQALVCYVHDRVVGGGVIA